MSVAARAQRKLSLPWSALALVLTAAIAATTTAMLLVETRPAAERREEMRPVTATAQQAPWQISRSKRLGGPPNRPQAQAAWRAGHSAVAAATKEIYDAMFLEGNVEGAVGRYLSRGAAAKMAASGFGWETEATRRRIIKRKARIALQLDGGARAVVTVKVASRARLDNERVRIFHRSILWFERAKNGWRVIAFDAMQEPAR